MPDEPAVVSEPPHTDAMKMPTTAPISDVRRPGVVLALVLIVSLSLASPAAALGAEGSAVPEAAASPVPTLTPAEALCESATDLRLIVQFLQATDVSEDGWLPLVVGAIAGLSEARTLAGLVGDTYRPLVDDLVVSLQDLRVTVESLEGMATVGAQIAAIGEAITDIGNAMDALAIQLRTRCPTDAE